MDQLLLIEKGTAGQDDQLLTMAERRSQPNCLVCSETPYSKDFPAEEK